MEHSLTHTIRDGVLAGAVGTAALNAVTYADMALRGRPASSTPEDTVQRAAELVRVEVPGDEEQQQARKTALGALLGTTAGVAAGVALALVDATRAGGRGAAATTAEAWVLAMVAGNGPMTVLGVTDPRSWSREAWVADVLPHLGYAAAAAATLRALRRPGASFPRTPGLRRRRP
jgi:hypothetical protein